jgi:hypothetical protein
MNNLATYHWCITTGTGSMAMVLSSECLEPTDCALRHVTDLRILLNKDALHLEPSTWLVVDLLPRLRTLSLGLRNVKAKIDLLQRWADRRAAMGLGHVDVEIRHPRYEGWLVKWNTSNDQLRDVGGESIWHAAVSALPFLVVVKLQDSGTHVCII